MLQFTVLAAALATAVVIDVRTRRIPNWLTGALAAAGFGMAFGGGVVMAFLYSAMAGGLLAVGHALQRRRLATTLSRTARLVATPGETKREIDGAAHASRFAYGPALAIGAIAAALLVR